MKLEFDPVADAAYFEISAAQIETTKEIEPGIIADYDADGHIVGIEVLSASRRGLPRTWIERPKRMTKTVKTIVEDALGPP